MAPGFFDRNDRDNFCSIAKVLIKSDSHGHLFISGVQIFEFWLRLTLLKEKSDASKDGEEEDVKKGKKEILS